MGIYDYFNEYVIDPLTGQKRAPDGSLIPRDVTVEDPTTPIDAAERDVLFPKGLPDQAHQGGLAQLAQQSMATQPSAPTQEVKAKEPIPQATPTGNAMRGQSRWMVNAPEAMAKADKGQREARAYGDIGYSVGSLVRLAAGAYGGAAAGGGGAGAGAGGGAGYSMDVPGGATGATGAAPGSVGGASSAQGGSLFGRGGGGGGGGLMGAYNAYQQGDYVGAGKDLYQVAQNSGQSAAGGGSGSSYLLPGEAPHGRGGGGGMTGTGSEIAFAMGNAGKRRAALAQLGYLPEFSPELATGDIYFSTTGAA